jgi:hypothetical protein
MIGGVLLFAAGWFCGIASVFIAILWAYRKGVGGC